MHEEVNIIILYSDWNILQDICSSSSSWKIN